MTTEDRLREMVNEAFAFEMDSETIWTSLWFTADDIVATVREWHGEELKASGVEDRAIRSVALHVFDQLEYKNWRSDEARQLVGLPPREDEDSEA